MNFTCNGEKLLNDRAEQLGLFEVCWFDPATLSLRDPVLVLAPSAKDAISQAVCLFRDVSDVLSPLENKACAEWSTATPRPFLIRGFGAMTFTAQENS